MDTFSAIPSECVRLGHSGENLARRIVFDLTPFIQAFGEGTAVLLAKRSGESDPYPAILRREEDRAVWELTAADTEKAGSGSCELQWHIGQTVVKSDAYETYVTPSLGAPQQLSPQQPWVDAVLQAGLTASSAAELASSAAQTAQTEAARMHAFTPQLVIDTNPGASVRCVCGETELSLTAEDGHCTFRLPDYGVWTLQAALGQWQSETLTLTVDQVKQYAVSLPIRTYHVYGIEWDGGASSKWTRTDDASGFADPVPYCPGCPPEDCSSPYDGCLPWSGIRRVELPGLGSYVSIPRFWYKWTLHNGRVKLQIADNASSEADGFRLSPGHHRYHAQELHIARYKTTQDECSTSGADIFRNVTLTDAERVSERKTNRHLLDFSTYWTVEMLYLAEYADWNIQSAIGKGCRGDEPAYRTGTTDAMPYHTGRMLDGFGAGVQYRYLEDLWAQTFEYVSGIEVRTDDCFYAQYRANNGYLQTIRIGSVPFMKGYVQSVRLSDAPFALLPQQSGGSTTTYLCDYFQYDKFGTSDKTRILRIGGYDNAMSYGLFYWNFNSDADTSKGGGTGFRTVYA